jgi:hypothetical protein
LHNDAPGTQEIERRTQCHLVAGRLEQDIDHALADAIGIQRASLRRTIDGAVRT